MLYRFKACATASTVASATSDEVRATPKGVVVVAPKLSVTIERLGGNQCPYIHMSWTLSDMDDSRVLVENADSIIGWTA